jgi:hypothetical protein
MELQLAHFSVEQYLKSGQIKEAFPEQLTKVGETFRHGLNEFTARGLITRVCLAYFSQLDEQRPSSKSEKNSRLQNTAHNIG